MDEEIKELLAEEIKTQIVNLSSLQAGSKEETAAIDNLTKLYKLRIEENKNEWDYTEKFEARMKEEELREAQSKEQMKDRYIRFGVAAAEIILPLIFCASWMDKGFKFEETGTYTSQTFRWLFGRFKPSKK